jgi:hypothetical protein
MFHLLLPSIAHAGSGMSDIAPTALVVPGLFFVILLLAVSVAFLPPGNARARRSLALLIVLVAAFGIFMQLLPLPLGTGASFALFVGIFAVIFLMGRFDAPD